MCYGISSKKAMSYGISSKITKSYEISSKNAMSYDISSKIRYIGADDPDQTFFENQYVTPKGMSYNSYVVEGEEIAVLDTVDSACAVQWFTSLDEVLAGRQPKYLVAHHLEPDHSALISEAMRRYPSLTLVASAKGIAMATQFFGEEELAGRTMAVGDGDVIDLGGRQLKVYTAPMVHWPEVIMTYDTAEKVLFSADAFGKFGALGYDDEWLAEARRYYCNIVGKYGLQVQAVLKKLSGLDLEVVAPLHGPQLRGDAIAEAVRVYALWSGWVPECEGVLVAYASVYGGTAKAAIELAEELRRLGKGEVVTMDLCRCDKSEAVAQAFRLSKALFASVTYDAALFPPMFTFLHTLKLKGWQKRRVGLVQNGSWAPVAATLMKNMLAEMKDIEVIEPVVTIKSTLHDTDRPAIRQLAESL